MTFNFAELQQKVDRLLFNISEQNKKNFKIFYDPTPQDVELPQLDENGNLVTVKIPNVAKLQKELSKSFASKNLDFWEKVPRNPTPDDVPPNNNALWLNTKTGEIFVHIKNCSGKAIWKGQLGTLVVPSTVTKFDIFEDGSAVALYRFEGTANDDGGRYDFEADKTPSFVDGKWGQAINIGNDLHLKIDNFPNFKEITISLWLFLPQRGTGWRNLLHITPDGQNMSGNSRQPAVFLHTNDIRRFHFRNDGVSTRNIGIDVSNAILTPGQWNHVVFIRTSEKLEIYLNSKKTDEYVSNEQFKHNSGTLYLHDTFYGAGFMVDQLRIFNRALTEEEIQILYKEMEEC